ncbi:MAG: patatin-like phospholipase family protein [Candidatus Thiodiazotropha sp. (ex Monitilora ramsayi)]|nr:patatin-like phospholipase family protein [Candidatus Thiodiazotropha sp. (ex Monitilora ramsayi)]
MDNGTPLILHLRTLGWTLNLTRMNVILLLATTILLSVAQGHDLLRGMVEDGGLKYLSLFGSTLLWATSLWLWARVLLDIKFPYALASWKQLTPYRRQLPRLFGVLAFAVVTLNMGIATDWHPVSYLMGIEGILFYLAVTYRRDLGRWIARKVRPQAAKTHWAWADKIGEKDERPPRENIYQALGEIRGKIAAATFVLGLALFAWGMLGPLSMGRHLDTLLLLMLWGATVLPLTSYVTYLASRRGFPIVIFSAILIIGFSFWNDNHEIRTLDGHKPDQRPSLEKALTDWHDAHCNKTQCEPFILVATAGGGIRAAYWTGTLLGRLHDDSEGLLKDHLFAISGVSGGSVGATVYRAVAANRQQEITSLIQQILGNDYLGPVAAGLLYKDALQRLMPLPLFGDRAEIFEKGLEYGFNDFMSESRISLESSFIDTVALDGQPWPALFLNATWSENGRRIVAASLSTEALAPPRGNQILYKDLLTTLGADMRLSTAAHNSARFPMISPPGGWNPVDDKQLSWQRLQDGGLFENFGAETALELAVFAEKLWQEKWGMQLRPYVILISSDPTLPKSFAAFPGNEPLGFAYETLSTLHTYATTRNGRGIEAAARLREWVKRRQTDNKDQRFFHLRMCHSNGKEQDPPLGWFLSNTAQTRINDYLRETDGDDGCGRDNLSSLKQLARLLKTSN